MQADEIYNLNLNIDKVAKVKVNDEKKEATISLNRSVIIQKFMGNIVTESLNNLEFFAMHFSHGTADESVVYQSLHQTYLMMVYVLYYNIAVLNELEGSKYYTNVIELYKKWDQRDQEEKQKKISMARNYTNKGSIVNKI